MDNLKSVTGFGLPYKSICAFLVCPVPYDSEQATTTTTQDLPPLPANKSYFLLGYVYVVFFQFGLRADADDAAASDVVVGACGPRQTLNGSERIPQ